MCVFFFPSCATWNMRLFWLFITVIGFMERQMPRLVLIDVCSIFPFPTSHFRSILSFRIILVKTFVNPTVVCLLSQKPYRVSLIGSSPNAIYAVLVEGFVLLGLFAYANNSFPINFPFILLWMELSIVCMQCKNK